MLLDNEKVDRFIKFHQMCHINKKIEGKAGNFSELTVARGSMMRTTK